MTDVDKVDAFISSPDAAKTAKDSGVVDGNYWFVD
jgi:hypothetical protein